MKRGIPLLFLAHAAFGQPGQQPQPPANSSDESISQQRTTGLVRDLRGDRAQMPSGRTFGMAPGGFLARDVVGKTVRFSAWIKTENVRDGYAGLWWNVQGAGTPDNRAILAFDNSQIRFIDGEPDSP